jgi:hypothetical protein|tara:strand:- start:15607 stop:16020 length:414 start_codon:yes stop_codon:yes gene_type:complete
MGCFSFICKESGNPVLSTSFSGDAVHLFLLKGGKVLEHMFGNYDSYGRVFDGVKIQESPHCDSFKWNMKWSDVCELMFNDENGDGIAAILGHEYDGEVPTTQSESDPNQGWGEHNELIGITSENLCEWVDKPFHKVL